jgi:hypothetical protein
VTETVTGAEYLKYVYLHCYRAGWNSGNALDSKVFRSNLVWDTGYHEIFRGFHSPSGIVPPFGYHRRTFPFKSISIQYSLIILPVDVYSLRHWQHRKINNNKITLLHKMSTLLIRTEYHYKLISIWLKKARKRGAVKLRPPRQALGSPVLSRRSCALDPWTGNSRSQGHSLHRTSKTGFIHITFFWALRLVVLWTKVGYSSKTLVPNYMVLYPTRL